ncbi:hypothetical protein BKA70DRAFT_1089732 [Coprinopsis sp. MPI-PUGE-AT-0042]|nr:hypothetical protein BKA70DRAFT_1089732 [Coprinopsis sp. MPI-PUGE-AT-0042]
MSLKDLLALAPIPCLDVAVTLVTSTYENAKNVKVYKQQCQDMSQRCVSMLIAIREGMHDQPAADWATDLENTLYAIDAKVQEWAGMSKLRSFLQQSDISEALDGFQRSIDGAMMKYQIAAGLALRRDIHENQAIQERDRAEIRELLQSIVHSTADMRTLVDMNSDHPVEAVMESLQTELRDPDISEPQEESFREGLWYLHQTTAKLPPLTDLTGTVTKEGDYAAFFGTFNDVFKGERIWLGREKRFEREVTVWRQFDHPNIVPLYGVAKIGEHLYSVSPWMDNGTALYYVEDHPNCDRLKMISEIVAGLEYLHSQNIVHGDLRAANVLISESGVARLSDFGLSKFLGDCGQGTTVPNVNPRWFAPELVKGTGSFSKQSDIWSLSMTFLEILSGIQPFSEVTMDVTVLKLIIDGQAPKRPKGRDHVENGLDDDMWDLIKSCWKKKPESRPTIQTIKARLAEIRAKDSIGDDTFSGAFARPYLVVNPTESRTKRPSTGGSSTSSGSGKSPFGRLNTFTTGTIDEHSGYFVSGRRPSTSSQFSPPFSPHVSSPSSDSSSSITRPTGLMDVQRTQSRPSPTSDKSSTSDLQIEYPGPPRLEIPHLSPKRSTVTSLLPPAQVQGRTLSMDTYRTTARSFASTIDSHHSRLDEAITSSDISVYATRQGAVGAGTFEGFTERLINNFNLLKDAEFRDVFLTGCIDLVTPEGFFSVLVRRFEESGSRGHNGDSKEQTGIQTIIFMVMIFWLSSRQMPVTMDVLDQMKSFCHESLRFNTSSAIIKRGNDLLQLIDKRADEDQVYSFSVGFPCSYSLKHPIGRPQTPKDLAVALTILEGEKYAAVMPCDYLAYLRAENVNGYHNPVEIARIINNHVIQWVKQSILHYDDVLSRADVIKFYIHTALECRNMRNFSSLIAIAIALNSAPVERLKLTKKQLPQKLANRLDEIVAILDPSNNHAAYRSLLREVGAVEYKQCVPWLALHLKQIHLVLDDPNHGQVIMHDGRPLINFKRYSEYVKTFRENLAFKAPDLDKQRNAGHLAYLEQRLADVRTDEASEQELMSRSLKHEQGESKMIRNHTLELAALGFSKPSRRRPTTGNGRPQVT